LRLFRVRGRLRNVTTAYSNATPWRWASEFPRRVDAGNPLLAFVLGPSWHPTEGAYRWMPGQASLRLAGPSSKADRLFITGYCPKEMFAAGPVVLSVGIDGQPAGQAVLENVVGKFTQVFALPGSAIGKASVEIH